MQMTDPTSTITTTPLQQIDAGGITYSYKRTGPRTGVPLVFLQHFRGNIDNWDPQLVDAIAVRRDVILFDNVGVGSTTGTTPNVVEAMAEDAVAFIEALGLETVDLFGYSLGGFVAQEIALAHPALVRRLILAGTGPKGAPGMERWSDDVVNAVVVDETGPAGVLFVFYAPTDSSQGAGQASLGRIYGWQDGRDEQPSLAAKDAQYRAVLNWGKQDWAEVQRLTRIVQPTLILQGDDDIMIPTRASHTMAGLIPGARIHIFPDASHGSIFQYAEQAAAETVAFVEA
jgi:pimeloyl-ACP methyl ester carboxylesterase